MKQTIIFNFKKLYHFGPAKIKREETLAKLYKERQITDSTPLHHNGAPLGYASRSTPPDNPLTVSDVIGRSLKYIGPYKKLDNTQQVVALIDDVSV